MSREELDALDRVWELALDWRRRADRLLHRASESEATATAYFTGERQPAHGQTSAEAGRPWQVASRDQRSRAASLSGAAEDLEALVAEERQRQWRVSDHSLGVSDHAGTVDPDGRTRMDTQTLATRLEGMAAFLRSADGVFAVSWCYVDPTPDGPEEPRTVHTVELDGSSAAEVLNNLDGLISRMTRLEYVAAEAIPGRVVLEALGATDAGDVRGTAVVLEPYATPLQSALDIVPTDPHTPATRQDLTLALVEQLAADPNMAPGVNAPEPPAVEVPPSDPSQTPSPSPSTDADGSTTGDSTAPPSQPQDSGPDSSAPTPSGTTADPAPLPDSPATPSVPDAPQQPTDSPASPESPTSSAPQPVDPATSETAGGTTPAPVSGDAVPDPTEAGGVVVRGNSDAPSQSGPGSPSPDPTSTATTGQEPAPVATGQQEGTQDGAPTNADGTPVEPTAGTTADVGSPAASTEPTADPNLPGQRPVAVSEEPLTTTPDGAGSQPQTPGSETAAPESTPAVQDQATGGDDRTTRIAALREELARLEAGDGGVATVTSQTDDVQVSAHADDVPEGGQDIGSRQGAGPTGDPAGGGYGSSAGGGDAAYNSDGM